LMDLQLRPRAALTLVQFSYQVNAYYQAVMDEAPTPRQSGLWISTTQGTSSLLPPWTT
jgi:hypothetical protein